MLNAFYYTISVIVLFVVISGDAYTDNESMEVTYVVFYIRKKESPVSICTTWKKLEDLFYKVCSFLPNCPVEYYANWVLLYVVSIANS